MGRDAVTTFALRARRGRCRSCSSEPRASWAFDTASHDSRGGSAMPSSAPHDPPFRAEHVGSLLRPPKLLKARAEHEAGRLSAAELRRLEDDLIRKVVAIEEELGLRSITDGEFRRG